MADIPECLSNIKHDPKSPLLITLMIYDSVFSDQEQRKNSESEEKTVFLSLHPLILLYWVYLSGLVVGSDEMQTYLLICLIVLTFYFSCLVSLGGLGFLADMEALRINCCLLCLHNLDLILGSLLVYLLFTCFLLKSTP